MATRIVIAAGGTAGTSCPRCASPTRCGHGARRSSGSEGRGRRPSSSPPPAYELRSITVRGLSRTDPRAAAAAGALAARALIALRPRSCASFALPRSWAAAGTSPGPVGLAAVGLRMPLVLSEADSHLGMTNRALAPFARRVCLAFPLGGARAIATG